MQSRKGVASEWMGVVIGVTSVILLFTVFYATGVGSTKKAYNEISSIEDTRILGRIAQEMETTRILLFNRTYTHVLIDSAMMDSNYLFYGNGYGYYLNLPKLVFTKMDNDIGKGRWLIEINATGAGGQECYKAWGSLDKREARVVYEKVIATPNGPGVMRIYAR